MSTVNGAHCDNVNQQFSILGVQGPLGTADVSGTAQTLPIGVDPLTGAMYSNLPDVTHVNTHTGNKELRVYQENHICTNNSSTTPLSAGGTFTGDWQDCLNYQEVNVSIVSDKDSATNGLIFQWSADGTTIGDTDVFSYYTSNGGTNYTPNPSFRYLRMVYINGSSQQTSFNLLTILRRGVTGGSFHRIDSTLKDDSDGRLVINVPKLKTAANTYVSQQATTQGNAKISVEEFESGISVNNKTQLKVTVLGSDGLEPKIEERKQTPTGNALNVQIGPGDVISNIPVMIDFDHHQIHEGETYKAEYYDTALDTNTVRFGFTCGSYANPIQGPHLLTQVDTYNGAALIQIYEGGTYSGGTILKAYNRNRNSSGTTKSTVSVNVAGTNGTIIDSFFVGASKGDAANGRIGSEWVLKSQGTYRIHVVGLSTGTDAVTSFNFYEDLGV